MLENPPANAGTEETGKIPWRRTGQPTPVFLPGESHGEKSLMGYGPWGQNNGPQSGAGLPRSGSSSHPPSLSPLTLATGPLLLHSQTDYAQVFTSATHSAWSPLPPETHMVIASLAGSFCFSEQSLTNLLKACPPRSPYFLSKVVWPPSDMFCVLCSGKSNSR